MKNYVAVKETPVQGRWLQPGDMLRPGPGVDIEKLLRKGFIELALGEEDDDEDPAESSSVEASADLREQLRRVEGERDAARGLVTTITGVRDSLQGRVTALEGELERERATVRLPEDAKARLVGVEKIGEALAEKAIAALTAPAPATGV